MSKITTFEGLFMVSLVEFQADVLKPTWIDSTTVHHTLLEAEEDVEGELTDRNEPELIGVIFKLVPVAKYKLGKLQKETL